MDNTEIKSSVWIDGNKETVWKAVTDEDKLSQWYAPGSPWDIPNLKVGEKIIFTLMPSAHNNLKEKLPMFLTIEKVSTYEEFSFYADTQQILISILLEEVANGTKVTMNMGGFDASLENLKALVEGKEITYK
ncbi:SRPBCC domain-containing protein [Metabacillus idriensis]|uniref:SRPBCC domain-containing protein n=1 Tax=Metabacillus idriensis TaxID=324768 RepID=UPI001CD23C3B|nr:SRPBCC domain-containing protein [Metabacillus idriensis]